MVSIIVPVYNVAQYLSKCIESILEQSYTDFELILVNDGSSDNSLEICKVYSQRDNRIVLIDKPNGGVSTARNVGILASKGEYITFVDSDDYLRKDFIEALITGVNDEIDLVVAGVTRVQDEVFSEFKFPDKEFAENDYDLLFSKYQLHKHGSPWGKLFKSSIINKDGIEFKSNIHLGEDIIFVFYYITRCRKIRLIDNPGYFYLQRSGSLTTKLNDFSSERAGTIEFQKIKRKLITQFNFSPITIRELNRWETIFLDRTKLAALKVTGYRKKYARLSEIDWSLLYGYKNYVSVREKVWDFLLAKKMFHFFLLLHFLRK